MFKKYFLFGITDTCKLEYVHMAHKHKDLPTDALVQGVSSAGATDGACRRSGVALGRRQTSFLTLQSPQRVFSVSANITSLPASLIIPIHNRFFLLNSFTMMLSLK